MSVTLYRNATEYTSNALTFLRGGVDDVLGVGVFHTTDLSYIPVLADFTDGTLADGTTDPPDPLAIAGEVDVVASIGPRGQVTDLTDPGDYQRFIYVRTAAEDIIRKTDVVTIL